MLDDGTKAAGAGDDVKVADIAIHLLDAIEAGEREFDSPTPRSPRAPSPSDSAALPDRPADHELQRLGCHEYSQLRSGGWRVEDRRASGRRCRRPAPR